MNLRRGESFSVRVTRVNDGDGCIVVRLGWFRRQRETLEVRLHAIDAPEYDQSFGREATHRLRRIAEGKRFTLRVWEPQDQFGRVVGVLYQRRLNRSVNRQMVESGMAYRFTHFGEMNGLGLSDAERHARRRKLGVWSLPKGGVRPWHHRQQQRAEARRRRSIEYQVLRTVFKALAWLLRKLFRLR